jgi:hypothetical protein
MGRRDRKDGPNPKDSAMLPVDIRGASDEVIDAYIDSKIARFAESLEDSISGSDPARRFIAVECMRLAVDPRVDERDVRSRSSALLNVVKTLGLDRDIQRVDISLNGIEGTLGRLRNASARGKDVSGRIISAGTDEAHGEVSGGSPVLLREPPERDQRAGEAGDVREAVPDSGASSGHH